MDDNKNTSAASPIIQISIPDCGPVSPAHGSLGNHELRCYMLPPCALFALQAQPEIADLQGYDLAQALENIGALAHNGNRDGTVIPARQVVQDETGKVLRAEYCENGQHQNPDTLTPAIQNFDEEGWVCFKVFKTAGKVTNPAPNIPARQWLDRDGNITMAESYHNGTLDRSLFGADLEDFVSLPASVPALPANLQALRIG